MNPTLAGTGNYFWSNQDSMFGETLTQYTKWLAQQPLSRHSKRTYRSRIKQLLLFASDTYSNNSDLARVTKDPDLLGILVKKYISFLKTSATAKASSINASLIAIDYLCQFLGIEIEKIKRERRSTTIPRSLSAEEQERFLLAIKRCKLSRDRALALLLFYTGVRIGECAALNTTDVSLSENSGSILVRDSANGDTRRSRSLSLNSAVREQMHKYLLERTTRFTDSYQKALFVNKHEQRLSSAGIDFVIRRIGWEARLVVSAQVLRNTCLLNLAQISNDPVLVANIGGHKSLDSALRYLQPNSSNYATVMENLCNRS